MTTKTFHIDCASCESDFILDFDEEFVSKDVPERCPFCGESIDDLEDVSEDSCGVDELLDEDWE